MKQKDSQPYDVAILGGGLAGLTCALHCLKNSPGIRVVVIEKRQHPVPEAAHKIGESSVEAGAYYFGQTLGLHDHLENEQIPKMGLRLFFPSGDNSRLDKRTELGSTNFPPTPSYQFDRGRFENFLAERCQEKGVTFLHSVAVKEVDIAKGRANHQIRIAHSGESPKEETISARWVVDASGRAALLKRKFGLKKDSMHKNNSSWFRIGTRIKVDDWCDKPEWQKGHGPENPRWQSTNHLLGPGYWVWLIPLSSGSTSIGIVADPEIHPLETFNTLEKTLAWLDKHEPQCAEQIRRHEGEIQDFSAIKRYAMECGQVFSRHRWGIVGDAGFFIDPFYSPGNDFIALANTFVCELIRRDLDGKTNLFHAPFYDFMYGQFYHGTAMAFCSQYPLFGHHQAMPVKILWDWMVYWTITAFFVCHERITDPKIYLKHGLHIKRLSELNQWMQAHLRKWHEETPAQETQGGVINTGMIALLTETNRALSSDLSDREWDKAFAMNVAQMETLFWEIVDHTEMEPDVPLKRRKHPGVVTDGFRQVFEVSKRQRDTAKTSIISAPEAAMV